MNLNKFWVPVAGVVMVAAGYRAYGWGGVGIVFTVLVTWVLLQISRMLQVLRRARYRPIGHVDSSVMLNARLKPRMSLLQVMALTRSIGQLESPIDEQPELFRWTDESGAQVGCEFLDGRLVRWSLVRPNEADSPEPSQQRLEVSAAPAHEGARTGP